MRDCALVLTGRVVSKIAPDLPSFWVATTCDGMTFKMQGNVKIFGGVIVRRGNRCNCAQQNSGRILCVCVWVSEWGARTRESWGNCAGVGVGVVQHTSKFASRLFFLWHCFLFVSVASLHLLIFSLCCCQLIAEVFALSHSQMKNPNDHFRTKLYCRHTASIDIVNWLNFQFKLCFWVKKSQKLGQLFEYALAFNWYL